MFFTRINSIYRWLTVQAVIVSHCLCLVCALYNLLWKFVCLCFALEIFLCIKFTLLVSQILVCHWSDYWNSNFVRDILGLQLFLYFCSQQAIVMSHLKDTVCSKSHKTCFNRVINPSITIGGLQKYWLDWHLA